MKCKILYLGRNAATHTGASCLESRLTEKIWRVLVDKKLTMSQHSAFLAKKAYSIMGCMRESIASRSQRWSFFSVHHHWDTSRVLGPVLGTAAQERHWHTGLSPSEAMGMIKVHEHLTFEGRLWEVKLFCLEMERLRRISSMHKNTWWETVKKLEPDTSRWCSQERQETRATVWIAGNTIKSSLCFI